MWRILRRSLVMDTFEDRPTCVAEGFIGKGVERGAAGGTDPVFARLSMFTAQRG